MIIDKEKILADIENLKTQREQSVVQLSALNGAIQYAENLIVDLEKPGDPEESLIDVSEPIVVNNDNDGEINGKPD